MALLGIAPACSSCNLRESEGAGGKDSGDIIRELEADGWRLIGATGSHHHFKHATKPGKVTVPHPTQGLASQDCKIDLSAGAIGRTAVRRKWQATSHWRTRTKARATA